MRWHVLPTVSQAFAFIKPQLQQRKPIKMRFLNQWPYDQKFSVILLVFTELVALEIGTLYDRVLSLPGSWDSLVNWYGNLRSAIAELISYGRAN